MPRVGNLAYILGLLALVPFLVLYLDGSVRIFVLSVQGRWGLLVATWVSSAGYGLVNAALAAIIMATGMLLGRPREVVAGRLGLFAVIAGGLSVQILKHLFCRSRPLAEGAGRFFNAVPCVGKGSWLRSFPSGHSVTAFALAYVLARTYPRGAPVFYALATMVALSRVYLASHFLSDIVAGAAFGLFAGWIVCRLAAFPLKDARS
jgi:membrane-associated phospholipid phosphatase